jgi:hypothetical protein
MAQMSSREMLTMLEELIGEYLAFQRSRPDLSQGSLADLSEDELERLVASFEEHKAGLGVQLPPKLHRRARGHGPRQAARHR